MESVTLETALLISSFILLWVLFCGLAGITLYVVGFVDEIKVWYKKIVFYILAGPLMWVLLLVSIVIAWLSKPLNMLLNVVYDWFTKE